MSKSINIHSILDMDLYSIMLLKHDINVRFDDGTVEYISYKDVIIMRFLLDFVPEFGIEITSNLLPTKYYSDGFFSRGTYLDIYSIIFKEVMLNLKDRSRANSTKIRLFERMYEAIDTINRVLLKNIIGYVADIEVTDLLKIQFDDQLMDSLIESASNYSTTNINNTYDTLDEVFRSKRHNNNPLTMLYLSKSVSAGQVKQLLGSRGYVTEIDSKIFNIPMTNSFLLGYKNIYDQIIESRAGGKAMYLSGTAIQNSEYMGRELNIATMFTEHIVHTDCGSRTYMEFYVRGKEVDENGNVVYKGDLKNLIGKHYFNEQTKRDSIITGKEEGLIGKFIKLRMAVNCRLAERNCVCSACIGEISHSVFDHQNIGHLFTTNAYSGLTQSLLSAKHLLTTAVATNLRLGATVEKFFMIKGNERLLFKANVLGKKTMRAYLKIRQDEAWGLNNAMHKKNMLNINVTQTSRLDKVILVYESANKVVEHVLDLKSGNRYGHLSLEAITYIVNKGFTTIDEEYYSVDIDDFNTKQPLFIYDKVEFDFAALVSEFKSLLKKREYKMSDKGIKSEYTPEILIQKLYELMNLKLNINIALLDVMVYSFTSYALNEFDFSLGRNTVNKDVVGFKEVINYRSIGAAYNWDDLHGKIDDPILFSDKGKVAHPMDVFFLPEEVLADKYK